MVLQVKVALARQGVNPGAPPSLLQTTNSMKYNKRTMNIHHAHHINNQAPRVQRVSMNKYVFSGKVYRGTPTVVDDHFSGLLARSTQIFVNPTNSLVSVFSDNQNSSCSNACLYCGATGSLCMVNPMDSVKCGSIRKYSIEHLYSAFAKGGQFTSYKSYFDVAKCPVLYHADSELRDAVLDQRGDKSLILRDFVLRYFPPGGAYRE